jgi:hypothetical protein
MLPVMEGKPKTEIAEPMKNEDGRVGLVGLVSCLLGGLIVRLLSPASERNL